MKRDASSEIEYLNATTYNSSWGYKSSSTEGMLLHFESQPAFNETLYTSPTVPRKFPLLYHQSSGCGLCSALWSNKLPIAVGTIDIIWLLVRVVTVRHA